MTERLRVPLRAWRLEYTESVVGELCKGGHRPCARAVWLLKNCALNVAGARCPGCPHPTASLMTIEPEEEKAQCRTPEPARESLVFLKCTFSTPY